MRVTRLRSSSVDWIRSRGKERRLVEGRIGCKRLDGDGINWRRLVGGGISYRRLVGDGMD
jgi:hypothetical protein